MSNTLDESHGNYTSRYKPIPEGYILDDSICITFFKWQNFGNGEQMSTSGNNRGERRGECGDQWSAWRILVSMELFYILVNIWTYTWWNCTGLNIQTHQHTHTHTHSSTSKIGNPSKVSELQQCQCTGYDIVL